MSMIPEDIRRAAEKAWQPTSLECKQAIARAILAERERCADVARHLNGWGYPPAPALADHIANIIEAGQ